MKTFWVLLLLLCIRRELTEATLEITAENNIVDNVDDIRQANNTPEYSFEHTSMEIFKQLPLYLGVANRNSCLLESIKSSLMWWTYPNGTLRHIALNIPTIRDYLDLSYRHISTDEALYTKIRTLELDGIAVFSAAYNNFSRVPQKALELMSNSLKYLTLRGNTFYSLSPATLNKVDANYINNQEDEDMDEHTLKSFLKYNISHSQNSRAGSMKMKLFSSKSEERIDWAQFPYLPNLIELDLSNCHIEFVTKEVFRNLSHLKSLYISNNKMLTIPFDTFYHLKSLQYLDMSDINAFDHGFEESMPTIEAFFNMVYGLRIQQSTFKYLQSLTYLDLSHTKLTRNSAVAFAHLGESLKFLSLCYTSFPIVGNALFKNTALIGLDLSGNTYAAYNMIDDAFEGISDSLTILYFERSNLKDISWIKRLNNLRVLSLAGNNVNTLSFDTFSPVTSLQVLDISANHVGNWYNRVFANNHNLRVLNLRENNINIITSEMLKDFSELEYLAMGDNNFVCDCMLKDLVNFVTYNTETSDCSRTSIANSLHNVALKVGERVENVNLSSILLSQTIDQIRNRLKNIDQKFNLNNKNNMKFAFKSLSNRTLPKLCESKNSQSSQRNDTFHGFLLKFQLLDYQEDHYWCFNETEKNSFPQLSCNQRSYTDKVAEKLHSISVYVVSGICTLLAISVIGLIIYFKRWYIYYYYSSLKSAALLSPTVRERLAQRNTLRHHDEPNIWYDIFISYCENDREWVFKELVPKIENTANISICLHERDFQVGITIVDNIVSCMDRSHGLMLIISSNFLLSQWCKFEMYLAQRRLFDACNDQLILVFLEDIPRSKRPKHLQYLMDMKTYIIWPGAKTKKGIRPEDRKLFWKRLKRALNI